MTFVIAQVTDTHLSWEKPFFVENFRRTAAHLRAAGPDLVINTGDVSLNGADLREDLDAARALHEEIGLSWRILPGNHDVGDNQETAKKQPINAERRARWISVFGDDFWSIDVPGWRLLGLNSLLIGSDLEAAAEQEAFITAAAAGLGERRMMLMLHKPLFQTAPDDDLVSGLYVNPGPRRRLFDALGTVRPALVACGHMHEHREHSAGGMHHIWAPATSFTVPDWFLATHGGDHIVGYVRHELDPDGSFRSHYVRPTEIETLDLADFPTAYGDLRQIVAERASSP